MIDSGLTGKGLVNGGTYLWPGRPVTIVEMSTFGLNFFFNILTLAFRVCIFIDLDVQMNVWMLILVSQNSFHKWSWAHLITLKLLGMMLANTDPRILSLLFFSVTVQERTCGTSHCPGLRMLYCFTILHNCSIYCHNLEIIIFILILPLRFFFVYATIISLKLRSKAALPRASKFTGRLIWPGQARKEVGEGNG